MSTGIRILNAATGLPGAIVARLLEATGAEVHTVRGDAADPFAADHPALPEWSAGWVGHSRAEVPSLLGSVDVLLVGGEDHPDAPRLALDPTAVRRGQERLVVLEIGGYVAGTEEPTPAVELLVQARTGMVAEQFADAPAHIAFAPGCYGAGLLGALGVWAALHQRLRTGRGDHLTVSLQQGQALFWPHLWLRAGQPDRAFDAVPPPGVRHLVFRCADGGHIQFVMGVPGALAKVHAALGIPGPVDPHARGVPDPSRGPEGYFGDRTLFARYAAENTRDELLARFGAVGIAAEPVLEPGECLTHPQVEAAGLVTTLPDGSRIAGPPLRVVPVGPGSSPRRAGDVPPDPSAGPLAGLRIVDLGNWVAGPFASRLLADLGAEVVNVEPPAGQSNLTGMRNTLVCSRGKRSLVLDLRAPDGPAVTARLAAWADAVHHNFRPGVAERLGVDAATLRAVNPALVYLHTTAYGQVGPRSRHSGFDMVMQALCGHEFRAGGAGNEPLWYRSPFVDYGAGALGAIGLLAGLYQQRTTGVGADVHTSLLACAAFLRGETVRSANGTVRGATLLAADRSGFHPAESIYRTADGWVALAARGEEAARRLAALAGIDEVSGRGDWGAGERAAISARLVCVSTTEALRSLAAAGVPAAACRRDALDLLLSDPAARRANLVFSVRDPRFGMLEGCLGPLVDFAGWRPDPTALRPVPLPGEHTDDVLAGAGYSPAEVARLVGDGVVRSALHLTS